ncbi:hypothetical protein AB4254_10845 [Vibrio breoganii]
MTTVTIQLVPKVPIHELNAEDKELCRNVKVKIDESVSYKRLASAALDIYHSRIPVRDLESFEFVVLTENGDVLLEPDDVQSYDLQHALMGDIVEETSPLSRNV